MNLMQTQLLYIIRPAKKWAMSHKKKTLTQDLKLVSLMVDELTIAQKLYDDEHAK